VTSLARRIDSPGGPSLTWLWYVLPFLFVAHAIVFWGRGLLDEEGMFYIQGYLADRSLLATIFDPNDTTLYQAREISYLFDIVDARTLGWLVDRGVVLFIPASGALGLIAVALIYLRGARKTLRLEASTSSLLLSLFLSCIVTQASTAIFYRSAKMILSVALFAFLFYLAALFRHTDRTRVLTFWRLGAVFLLGLIMSLTDRQGLFYLLMTILILGLLWLAAWARGDSHSADRFKLAAACFGAAVAAAVYSFVVAPRLIAWTGGAGVSFAGQKQSLADFNWTLVSYGFEIFRGQVRYLFGNAPFAAVAVVALTGAVFAIWRHRSQHGSRLVDFFIGVIVVPAAMVMLLAFMVLYHRPIYTIPDHTLWYYTLTVPAVLVFGLTLLVASFDLARVPVARYLVHAVLLVMIASNVLHYSAQRHFMIDARYIGEQYNRTQQILKNDADARAGRSDPGQRPWLRVESIGAVVALPVEDEAFPREVQAAYETYTHRRPLDEATGPYWSRIYEFLSSSPTRFDDPKDLSALVEGLRSVGVRRIELSQGMGNGDAQARPTAEALRATGQTTGETARGEIIAFDLAASAPRLVVPPLRQIPAGSFRATASQNPDQLSRAFDGNEGTYWSTNAPQAGNEWIRIEFDRAVDVGCVRLFFIATNPGRNPVQPGAPRSAARQSMFKESFRPRGLVIDTIAEGGGETVTPFNPMGALIQALLRNPVRPTMEFCLAPNQSRTLVLLQTGRSSTDPWNVAELTVWERK
jgi:hypothetical protein